MLAWGDALREAAARRRRRIRRGTTTAALCAVLLGSAALRPAPLLVWNASASAPIGLYAITPAASPAPGDMALAWPPADARRLAARRHYLPATVPLVKRVAAAAGDEVCARQATVFINGSPAAARRARDGQRRPMPGWTGCVRLRGRQLFLLADDPASFDGRYFGVTEARDILGRARLLWRR